MNTDTNQQNQQSTGQINMDDVVPDRAQTITLYVNGDRHFFGKKLLVNKRRIRSWEAFLRASAETTGEPLAVREIATPNRGTRIDSLDKLQDRASYVTISKGDFRPIGSVCARRIIIKQRARYRGPRPYRAPQRTDCTSAQSQQRGYNLP